MQTVSIIGVGRIGGALALALDAQGYPIESLIQRNEKKGDPIIGKLKSKPQLYTLNEAGKIGAGIIFICTQDAEVFNVGEVLAAKLASRPHVFHTSGALSSEILKELKENGCPVGSIHPLVSISDAARGAEQFRGAYFCIEGEPNAAQTARRIVADLGGESFSIETEHKALYHAAAVNACGHLVALLDASIEMMTRCGLDEEKAKSVFLPLVKSTIGNLERQTPSEALTGTFARADLDTFRRHLDALGKNVSSEILEIYLLLGLRSLPLALEQGASKENIARIQKELLLAKKKLKC